MKPNRTSPALHRAYQQGGTLLGIIIGLVIGLSIAIAVALLITKSSTPFTNKGAKPADTPVTQITDPNKPLYGNKDAVKEAAKEVAQAAAQPRVAPEVPVDGATPAAAGTPAAAADKPADAGKAAPAQDDKFIYFLQAGAFRSHADAESARAKLALSGFEAQITETTSDTGTIYRVRLGPYAQADLMNRTKTKLSENGVDVAVIRTPK